MEKEQSGERGDNVEKFTAWQLNKDNVRRTTGGQIVMRHLACRVGFKYNETTTRALTLLQTRTLSEEHGTLTLFQIDFLLMLDPLKDVDEEISCLVWVLYRVSQASMH
ncbi:uncharacterized protein PHALS_09831 [Plasmopara halstedii]|uniref:Uncharacterized protein n=1 Tax=Plasmopara halstedii TaxID=4781 RepID=A0A0P1AG45_PLAHL|nr:uncharacterized protein PHALS_09831 [Plasmopara halstedii]CEG39592.1 hypothetical protein PHALS_09831 [Plasmopara halstedii]|eukprot:XP_024575961.1 hypothetical protein PHALS_09831 [Plasmopara halstedii]